jgi:hypothetical protein
MRTGALSLAAAWLAVGALTAAQAGAHITFDQDKPGAAPGGFSFAATRQPATGLWLVRRQGSQGFLVHDADRSATGYALAISAVPSPRDVSVSVRLRLAGGARSGGLVWHYQDEHNYFASVLDLSRGELSMYRMAGGNRVRMEFEDDLELDADAWHTMKVVHSGDSTRVSLGGIRVFEDEHHGLDRAATGRIGLIATGDAEVWYDDLHVDAPSRSR